MSEKDTRPSAHRFRVEAHARQVAAAVPPDDPRFANCVAVIHRDGSLLFFNNAFMVSSGLDADYLVVFTKQLDTHVFHTEDVERCWTSSAREVDEAKPDPLDGVPRLVNAELDAGRGKAVTRAVLSIITSYRNLWRSADRRARRWQAYFLLALGVAVVNAVLAAALVLIM